MNQRPDIVGGKDPTSEDLGIRKSSRKIKTFASLWNPMFRLYYYSLVGYWAPMNMQMITRSLLMYRITDSGALVGYMALASAVPMIILSLYGGVIADHVNKKMVLIYGQMASAVVSIAVGLTLSFNLLSSEVPGSWWILIVTSFLQGVILGVIMPSRISFVPEIVSEEDLMNAISLSNMGMNLFGIIAPASTGFIIDAWGFAAVYYTMGGLYLISCVFMYFVRTTRPIVKQAQSTLSEIVDGLRYIKGNKIILMILIFTLSCTILGMPFNTLLPLFTEDILGVGASGQGLILALSGFGAIIVSIILASISNKKRGIMMIISGIILSIALINFSFNTTMALALMIAPFVGLGQTGQMAIGMTLVQYYVDPVFRGRAMSIQMLGFGMSSLGVVFAGLMSESMGIEWSIAGLAILLGVIAVAILIFSPKLRKLD